MPRRKAVEAFTKVAANTVKKFQPNAERLSIHEGVFNSLKEADPRKTDYVVEQIKECAKKGRPVDEVKGFRQALAESDYGAKQKETLAQQIKASRAAFGPSVQLY